MKNSIFKVIELAVAEHYYEETQEVIFVPIGYFTEYDGISQSKQFRYECKFEEKAAVTMNLCFEFSYKGRPSGLAATEASTWVHVVPVTQEKLCCYEFDVETLRDVLKHFPLYRAGDGMYSKVKLLTLQKAEQLKTDKFFITINWDEFKPYW